MAENHTCHDPGADASHDSLPNFYRRLGNDELLEKIKNLDDPKDFHGLRLQATKASSRNFVVDFGDDCAWCAFDISDDALKALMSKQRPSSLYTRWINIWLPYKQKDFIGVLAKHYDFSPRLFGLMKSDPVQIASRQPDSKHSSSFFHRSHRYGFHRQKASPGPGLGLSNLDQESQLGMEMSQMPQETSLPREISHYQLIDEVWHWTTVDEGRRYVCLGYNSLHNTPQSDATLPAEVERHDSTDDLPDGKRVWTWLLLCEDKTVITIHEDPYPCSNGILEPADNQTLLSIRRNLLNVFRNLSLAHDTRHDPPISILPIRRRVGNSDEETAHRASDAPGLLFYNLFDDWFATYSLVARREHKYAAALDQLRNEMLKKAELTHINQLNRIGRQLAVLKRLYMGYEVIIDRVLEKQEATLASLKNSHIMMNGGDGDGTNSSVFDGTTSLCDSSQAVHIGEQNSLLGVALSSAARARFKRLKYRTRLYAISEIEECLNQKESLVMMNFNLIAIKESLSVERLTRITLLLAKATLLFMPVSLMAAYFSCQFTDQEFTNREFWTWFAIVLSVTIVALIAFSFISGTMEGKMLYRSMSRAVMDVWKDWWGKRRREKKGQ